MCRHDPAEWTNEFGAYKDLRDIPWEHRIAIKKGKRREIYDQAEGNQKSIIGEVREYEGESRLQAIKLAAQLHSMLPAPTVQNNQFNLFLDRSDAELDFFIEHHEWPEPAEALEGAVSGRDPSKVLAR